MASKLQSHTPAAGPVGIQRLPQTPEELWWTVKFLFDVEIPRVAICNDHVAPFDAFADAYFAWSPVSIWKASRGFGGKSYLLSLLTLTEATLLGAESSVLGGSGAQSLNVHEHTLKFWSAPNAPRHLLIDDPAKSETVLSNGAKIRALLASQTSVRGPHPQRLRMDEIDEMKLEILEAAQGQPQPDHKRHPGVAAQTVMSSTHQYPDGTMTAMLKRAREKGWTVHHWCYRESMGTRQNPGWLRPSTVMQKQTEVANRFWNVEYELQAPSFDGRAIDSEMVEAMFDEDTYIDDQEGKLYTFEDPEPGRRYITGVDWAKQKDWTIIWTFDLTERPMRAVAYMRVNRRPWPEMIEHAVKRLHIYPGTLVHDSTGLGNVVHDLIEVPKGSRVIGRTLVGRAREEMFNEYISAIEDAEVRSPRIEFAFEEHLYVTDDDLFKTGGHPPDTFVAGALAWSARNVKKRSGALPQSVREQRTRSPWTVTRV